ncbi:MAG TPA: carbohydrate-binding protein [Anaerolineales bacterium]|nr:carbohydrate-binding protein [Anaerolineales bacterium]
MRRILYVMMLLILAASLVLVIPARAADRGAWAPNVAYAVGDTVTYNGLTYQCLQAHTSLTGWEPPNVPALWKLVTGGATNTPTRTPTRTNTQTGPTATRTNTPVGPTPTRTNTPVPPTATTGGSGCWPAWVSTTAYNGGAQVSRNGQNYQAAYWTQGNDPATSSGPAGSGQPWIPMGACGTGPTATPTRTPTSGPTATNLPPGSINYNAAPYVMPLDNNPPDIAQVMSSTGIKAFTIAFILANGSSCSPAWDGTDPVSSDTQVGAYINTIRANGGDVVPSIGGYGGTKLGQVCGSGSATYSAYQQVVTKYNLKAIDFDIEEPEIENAAAVANELYAAKQFVSQGLNVSVTMPVTTSGLNYFAMCSVNNSGSVLSWAQANGFTPTSWNIMPFDGGFASPMGTSTVNVAEIFHGQLKTCFGWDDATAYAHSGLSLMNGRSDSGEYTYQADFTTILNYAKSHGLKRLTFWSVNRDRSCNAAYGTTDPGTKGDCSSVTQNPWDFTKIIAGY